MKVKKHTYTTSKIASSIFMILVLVWLTVSTPFVFRAQQQLNKEESKKTVNSSTSCDEEDAPNPFANTTEEKAPTSVSTISEYLNEAQTITHPVGTLAKHHKYHSADLYIAFHGELLSPPPEC